MATVDERTTTLRTDHRMLTFERAVQYQIGSFRLREGIDHD